MNGSPKEHPGSKPSPMGVGHAEMVEHLNRLHREGQVGHGDLDRRVRLWARGHVESSFVDTLRKKQLRAFGASNYWSTIHVDDLAPAPSTPTAVSPVRTSTSSMTTRRHCAPSSTPSPTLLITGPRRTHSAVVDRIDHQTPPSSRRPRPRSVSATPKRRRNSAGNRNTHSSPVESPRTSPPSETVANQRFIWQRRECRNSPQRAVDSTPPSRVITFASKFHRAAHEPARRSDSSPGWQPVGWVSVIECLSERRGAVIAQGAVADRGCQYERVETRSAGDEFLSDGSSVWTAVREDNRFIEMGTEQSVAVSE